MLPSIYNNNDITIIVVIYLVIIIKNMGVSDAHKINEICSK